MTTEKRLTKAGIFIPVGSLRRLAWLTQAAQILGRYTRANYKSLAKTREAIRSLGDGELDALCDAMWRVHIAFYPTQPYSESPVIVGIAEASEFDGDAERRAEQKIKEVLAIE